MEAQLMATITKFEDIEGWRKARELTREIYRISGSGQFARDFALGNQIRKASVSIMSNVAEGFERDGNSELRNFLSIAKGSAGEVRSQLYVALDQNYIDSAQFEGIYSLSQETARTIAGFMNYLRDCDMRGNKFR
jgi:four helix bundle protein